MKKYFIIVVMVLVLLFGGYYYDKNIRYGKASHTRVINLNEGHYFKNSEYEEEVVYDLKIYANPKSYIVISSKFMNEEQAKESFVDTMREYKMRPTVNFSEKNISNGQVLLFDYGERGVFAGVQIGNRNIQVTSRSSFTETDSFVKWLIRYN